MMKISKENSSLEDSILDVLRSHIKSIDVQKWSLILLGLSLVGGGFWTFAKGKIIPSGKLLIDYVAFGTMFFLWGSTGFLWLYRREFHKGKVVYRGNYAIFMGIVFMSVGWGMTLWSIYLAIQLLSGNCITASGNHVFCK